MRIDPAKYDLERARAVVSNSDIAQRLDISMSWVTSQNARIKKGENLLPETVGRLAAAIGCPVEALLIDAGRGGA